MWTQTGPSPPHARPDRRVTDEAWARGPSDLATRSSHDPLPGLETPTRGKMGEAAQIPPWPLRKRSQPLPYTHRTGNHGIAWDFMGVNGKTRKEWGRGWENVRDDS